MLAPRCDSAVSVILLQHSGWGRRQVGGPRWRGWRLLWASLPEFCLFSLWLLHSPDMPTPPPLLKALPSSRASSQGLGEKWGACTEGTLRGQGPREAVSVPAGQSTLFCRSFRGGASVCSELPSIFPESSPVFSVH